MAHPTKEELNSLAIEDPEINAVLKSGKMPLPKLDYSSSDTLHQLRALEALFPPPPAIPEVIESNLKFTARDGTKLNLFVFSASAPTAEPKPLVIFYHGGGGVMGNAYSAAALARDLVLAHDCVVVSPQYRLAPEHAFPTGVTDALDAFKHVSINASSFGADVSAGLIVGGVSQGARMTAIIALQAKDSTTTPKITGLYFSAGSFISSKDTIPDKYKDFYLSRTDERCLAAPLLSADMKALFDREYGADVSSPIHAAFNTQPLSKHAGIAPKVYFQICGMDILRDDSFIYAAVLEDLGVQTRADVYPGTPHVFWSLFRTIKQAQTWKADKDRGVGWLLGREH
ncbi:hypothetical protein PV11_04077 [Exophiala sideris]|uniref:Alpha/beta hydrolase fold-3 domain-containing protein n=1 Tax=Exophiala sideris TaxID=1016849 RepID=A0A0D1VZS1_9EURO|nr:hypothetical protein PV11_04077 [Exophiala sideris]